MAKRGRKKGSERSRKKPDERKQKWRKTPLYWIGGIIAVAVIFLVMSGRVPFTERESKKGRSFYVQGGETRPLLDPSLFRGRTREAYAAAKKYPEVLDQVFCYCTCDEPPFNHKSLLSCFTDKHGAG